VVANYPYDNYNSGASPNFSENPSGLPKSFRVLKIIKLFFL
jgi:hypothetical protein